MASVNLLPNQSTGFIEVGVRIIVGLATAGFALGIIFANGPIELRIAALPIGVVAAVISCYCWYYVFIAFRLRGWMLLPQPNLNASFTQIILSLIIGLTLVVIGLYPTKTRYSLANKGVLGAAIGLFFIVNGLVNLRSKFKGSNDYPQDQFGRINQENSKPVTDPNEIENG